MLIIKLKEMRKIIYFVCTLSAIIMMMPSCSDRLDILPYNELETSIVLNSPSNFEIYTRGIYGQLRGYYAGVYTLYPDVVSDNLILKQNGIKTHQNTYLLNLNSSNTWGSIRDGGHNVIFSANTALGQLDVLEDGDFKDNLRGEYLALRGLAHFDIAKVYAKTPSVGSSGDLGVIYRKDVNIGTQPSRLDLETTYSNIVNDLETAKSLISEDNGVGRLNLYAVYGILSRVYLYMGEWELARDNAQFVLDNSPYEVTPSAQFNPLWDNSYNGSSIFKILIDNQDGISMGVNYGQTGPDGTKSVYVPDFEFYQMYSTDDVRRDAYFETSAFDNNLYNHMIKYRQRPGSPANVADIPVLRMDEVVLNLAEAQAELNNDGAALQALDLLRLERYGSFISGNEMGQQLKDAIQLERRLELAFEGHRYFDLKRKGLGFTRSTFGDFADGTGTPPPSTALGLAADDHRFVFPYSLRELDINPNLVQNPEY